MSNIRISYARPNEPLARKAAEALRAAGYAVWRDDELPGADPRFQKMMADAQARLTST